MSTEFDKSYDRQREDCAEAMRRFPIARWREFDNLFVHVDRGLLHRVLDVSSCGPFLGEHLPEGVELVALDRAEQRFAEESTESEFELSAETTSQAFDLVVSLASMHLIQDKPRFTQALLAATRPGGWIVMGDVVADSSVARFLNDFVSKHNGLDRVNQFWSGKPLNDLGLAKSNTEIICNQVIPCDWRFDTEADVVAFVRQFFHLKDVSDAQIEEAVGEHVGITRHAKYVTLNWELLYVTLQVPAGK